MAFVPVPKDLTTKVLQKKYLGIESDIIKQQRVRNKNNDFSTLYFDKYSGSSNSTSVLTVRDNESIERSLKEIYECVKNHEMRSHFKYMRITFKEMSGRLEFNFKLDKEGDEIVKENDRKLTESIENFYKGTNYWGD